MATGVAIEALCQHITNREIECAWKREMLSSITLPHEWIINLSTLFKLMGLQYGTSEWREKTAPALPLTAILKIYTATACSTQ